MTEKVVDSQATELERRSGNRRLNRQAVTNALIITGVLMFGGGVIDYLSKALTEGERGITSANALVSNYEHTAVALGKQGKLDQIPQKFNSQQVKDAYKKSDSENTNGDVIVLLSGYAIGAIGLAARPRRKF